MQTLEFGDEILQEKWSVLCVVLLAAAIHSKRLWDPHWPSDPHSPTEETGKPRSYLSVPSTSGSATGRGFCFLVKRNCAGLIREGPTIPRLLRCLKTFTEFSRQVLPFFF